MNFSDRITFVTRSEAYDPDIGEVVEKDTLKVTVPCHLSTLGTERTNELFGSINRVITVARLQRPYEHGFTHVEIDGQSYQVERQSNYRKGVLFLEGLSLGKQRD